MIRSHFILAICWILYCVLHSALANDQLKARITAIISGRPERYRLGYNVIAFAGLFIILSLQVSIKSIRLFKANHTIIGVAFFAAAAGLAIMGICIAKYFRQLSGISSKAVPALEISGIHQYVRHPLYLGTFIFLTGLFLYFPLLSNLLAVVIIIVYTLIGIRFEEQKLVARFGKAYRTYQRKTPMIVPFFGRK